jgi:hypothetical protein
MSHGLPECSLVNTLVGIKLGYWVKHKLLRIFYPSAKAVVLCQTTSFMTVNIGVLNAHWKELTMPQRLVCIKVRKVVDSCLYAIVDDDNIQLDELMSDDVVSTMCNTQLSEESDWEFVEYEAEGVSEETAIDECYNPSRVIRKDGKLVVFKQK